MNSVPVNAQLSGTLEFRTRPTELILPGDGIAGKWRGDVVAKDELILLVKIVS